MMGSQYKRQTCFILATLSPNKRFQTMTSPQSQNGALFSFSFAPTNMSAAQAEWNRYAGVAPGHEESSSDKDKYPAPRDGVSATPLASNSSRAGTGGDTKIERSPAKNASPAATPRDTMTPRGQSNEAITERTEMETRKVIGPPEFFYSKNEPFYSSETRSASCYKIYMYVTEPQCRALPKFWTKHVHFSGKVYFHNRRFNLVTPDDIRERLILQKVEQAWKQNMSKFKKVIDPQELPYCSHVVTLPRIDSPDSADVYHVVTRFRRVLRMNGDEGLYSLVASCITSHLLAAAEEAKELFWKHLESYPMHYSESLLPWDFEVEFLNAITFGANGSFLLIDFALLEFLTLSRCSERIRDFRNTPFPFVDRQCERFLRIYQDLKGSSIVLFCTAS